MNGYLMNFFKYGAADIEDFDGKDKMYMNAHEGEEFVRSVVWSIFDRLEIREITSFDEFRLSQYSEKKWVGERQFALLYEISNSNKRLEFQKSNDKCRFAFHKVYEQNITVEERESAETKFRFFGISMIDLAPEVHYDFFGGENSGYTIHDKMLQILDELVIKNNINSENICYDIYGTLGGNDIVIIWLTNEYRDVITLIEAMRKSKIKNRERSLLANVYTIMGLRDINNHAISYEAISGKLNIRLTKKGTYRHEEFINALKKYLELENIKDIPIETTLGEHDISIKISGIGLIKNLYNDQGLIHIRNEKFFENIIQANTELSVQLDYENIQYINYSCDNRGFNRTIISVPNKQEVYKDIEIITQNELFDKLPYLKETLWILYEDYLKNISSAFSYPWVGDLHYQFSKSILYLKDLVKVDNAVITKDRKYEIIRELIGTIRQTLLHVSQANRLFFEIPNTHLKNTGTYSKVLRTYYGVVKQLLLQAYSIPKSERQASIVPFITFDVIPKIVSSMLPQLANNEYIIVNIVLPYEALIDIPKYAKLLAHEVFHYIAPRNRYERNAQIGIISVTIFFVEILKKYFAHVYNDMSDCENICDYLYPHFERECLEYVINEYDEITECMKMHNDDTWEDYFGILDSLYGKESINFIYMSEIHNAIFSVFEKVFDNVLCSQTKGTDRYDIMQRIVDKATVEDFCKWIEEGAYRNITDFNFELKYALREAMADYFMIQVMNSTTSIGEYFSLNLDYKDLLESEDGGIDYRQELRIAIITDIVFDEITKKIDNSNIKQILSTSLFEKLKTVAELPDKRIEKVILYYGKYYEMCKRYRGIIKL